MKKKPKPKKIEELAEAISEFIGEHDFRNHHYLRDEEIIEHFSYAKAKHVRLALKEVR